MPLVPAAVQKTIQEGQCRACVRTDIETAHLWPRGRGGPGYNDPDITIPLCKRHHTAFDEHEFDVLPYLSLDEQLATVREAGGIAKAYRRLAPGAGSIL